MCFTHNTPMSTCTYSFLSPPTASCALWNTLGKDWCSEGFWFIKAVDQTFSCQNVFVENVPFTHLDTVLPTHVCTMWEKSTYILGACVCYILGVSTRHMLCKQSWDFYSHGSFLCDAQETVLSFSMKCLELDSKGRVSVWHSDLFP